MKFPIAIGALKPNHFEETYPEEGSDSGAIEVRLTPRSRGFGIDDIDVGEETHGSSGSQASNANRRGKTLVYWMWWGLGMSASFVFFVTAITVGGKRQQQKKIAAAAMLGENCLDVSVRLDSDEQPAPMDLVQVPAAAPVDDAAGAVPSPFSSLTCGATSPGCIQPSSSCNQNQCDGTAGNNASWCCTCRFRCCGPGGSDCICLAGDAPTVCPSSAPSRMVSVICIAI